eukprot:m.192971 g.192971  ORF g.192971 m.192971 type:complete len:61 (-) comp18612_c0_seq16:1983-2165(-)
MTPKMSNLVRFTIAKFPNLRECCWEYLYSLKESLGKSDTFAAPAVVGTRHRARLSVDQSW